MSKKFEVRWLYDGHYTIDTVDADTADEAVSTVECCFNTAKEYQIISVKEITSKEDTTMKKMKTYTFEQLNKMEFDDITEDILKEIRNSSCVKCAKKVGKKIFNEHTGKFFKKVLVYIDEASLTNKQKEDFYERPLEYYVTLESNKKLYVAYGSNLHLGQMAYRCPEAKVYGAGVLKNYELTFWGNWGRNGVATVLPHAGTDVPVGVWEISAADEKNLDIYEGWPRLYRKEDIEVTMADGSVVTAMVYIMNENGMRATYPSDSYFNTIATGYRSFGFDLEFLKAARDRISVRDFRFKNF